MQVVLFSKMLQDDTIEQLIERAHKYGAEGYDLCVRPGYAVNPDNAAEALPKAVEQMAAKNLKIAMITGNFDLLTVDHPTTIPILSAMDRANVRLLKLGYFKFDPLTQDYWAEVDRIRRAFADWEKLGRQYNVKICYHTHSDHCMGGNCAAMCHLIRDFDPSCIGAYIDPAHMLIEGEEFEVGLAMIREYLSIVALKDVMLTREPKDGHGKMHSEFVMSGEGMVDWTKVFADLVRERFDGPLTVHCQFDMTPEQIPGIMKSEVSFYKAQKERALSAGLAAR